MLIIPTTIKKNNSPLINHRASLTHYYSKLISTYNKDSESRRKAVIRSKARSYIGTPYHKMDCSSYIVNLSKDLKQRLPIRAVDRRSYGIFLANKTKGLSQPKEGRLVFCFPKGHSTVTHIGYCVTDSTIIHSTVNRGIIEEKVSASSLKSFNLIYKEWL